MTEKQLRRLRRPALIELLIEQIEENERLEARLSDANDQLRNREITISNAGSIAEAALTLNAVFDDAQKAVDQYIENVKRMTRPEAEGEADPEAVLRAEQAASGIVSDARLKASGIVSDAEQRASGILSEAEQRASGIVSEAEQRASGIVSGAEQEAAKILRASLVRAEEIGAGTVEAIGVNMGVVPLPEPEPEPLPEPESEPVSIRAAMEPRWDEVFAQMRRRNR